MKSIIKINQRSNHLIKNIYRRRQSLSIRWALLASQAKGTSRSYNLLRSEDVISTLKCLKKLGTIVKLKKNFCEIRGRFKQILLQK